MNDKCPKCGVIINEMWSNTCVDDSGEQTFYCRTRELEAEVERLSDEIIRLKKCIAFWEES